MNYNKWKSVAKGAAIAAVGAALTYLTQWITNADLGAATPMVVALLSVLTNLVRKYIQKGDDIDDLLNSGHMIQAQKNGKRVEVRAIRGTNG